MKLLALTAATLALCTAAAGQSRIKDIAGVQGVRSNQLVGFGVVIGLDGSGDSNSAAFTPQAIANMLQNLGMKILPSQIKAKNVASVMVTADLPPYAKNGSRIDINVGSLGDARSLQGGMLIQTPLKGADGEVYAVAQGSISIGGFNVSAGGSQSQKNHVTEGRIPGGATVEKEVPTTITDGQSVDLTLRAPDFTTASRVAEAINLKVPGAHAAPKDAGTVHVDVPEASRGNLVSFLATVEALEVTPDTSAKVIINERTGTLVVGGDVRVKPCAIAHGGLQIKVENTPIVAIPAPFSSSGQPVVVPQKSVTAKEEPGKVAAMPAVTTIDQLVQALNMLGVSPRDLIPILQAMHDAGAITAQIELQ